MQSCFQAIYDHAISAKITRATFRYALLELLGRLDGVAGEDKLEETAGDKTGSQVRGQIVMQEQLATHEVERSIMGGPSKEEEARRVVQMLARACDVMSARPPTLRCLNNLRHSKASTPRRRES